MLTHFSLFTGIGGIDLASELAGFETVGQCEWADYPTKVLEKHWPDVPRWRDIRSVTAESFRERTGLHTVTLVSGGFPCQPFSLAGNRKGKEDDRYLWPEMLRVIQELQPTWVLGENVAGIITMGESASFSILENDNVGSTTENMVLEEICQALENIGYEVQTILIPACSVGAPHQRYRTFIMGYSKYNGQLAEQKLRSNEATSDKWRKKEPIETRKPERANRSVNVPSISGSESRGEQNKNVANSNNKRLQRSKEAGNFGKSWQNINKQFAGHGSFSNYWAIEPDVGRVVNGIPDRVDRIKCLGNAVVPQQVYPILQAIADIERGCWT